MFSAKPLSLSDLNFSPSTETALRKDPFLGRKLAGVARDLHQLRIDSRTQQAGLLDYYTDKTAGYKAGTAHWMAPAKAALESENTPAGVLLIAARNILGPGMAAWEPDTIRIELEENEGLKIPAVNFDKLLAATTLTEVPAFYMEVLTFQNTVLAFNHQPVDAEVVQEASPEQIAWAVFEAELIRHENQLFEPEFDYEPCIYTAQVLHRAGMVLAPALLSFAQDCLDGLNTKDHVGLGEVRSAWEALPKESLASRTFTESPLDVQLAKLASVEVYVSENADGYTRAMGALSRAP